MLRPGTRANRAVRRQVDAAGRRLRYLGGQLRGASYRMRGRRPDPDVIDSVLADRVRSSLGRLEKQLDIPHIHVMVESHVVALHGEVGSAADAEAIERAVAAVSGVLGVESYLHTGLTRGDTRPSQGREQRAPSAGYRALVDAAVEAGTPAETAPAVVLGILATFADRIPEPERAQVDAHLPADVRPMFRPPRRTHRARPVHTVTELVSRIAVSTGALPHDRAERIVSGVLDALRSLVPEEAADVGAVLPAELRALWHGSTPNSAAETGGARR
jgi:uncharacterized protein (DUF2267 family)